MTSEPTETDGVGSRRRDTAASDRMTEHEALMWNVEKDPWLNPSGAALVLLDRPIDIEHFRLTMRRAIAQLPRLYQRVVPGFARLSTPAWAPDPEFDLDHHLRSMTLPSPGTEAQLFELATQLYQEPFDRTRPLWRFVVIDGLESGRGALWMITHHAISDGIGQLRMAELYQTLSPDTPAPDPIDLEAIIADAVAAHRAKEAGGDLGDDLRTAVTRTATHLVRRQIGLTRRALGEVALWPLEPERAVQRVGDLEAAARGSLGQLLGSGDTAHAGSPLWTTRSRHRHLEHVRLPLDLLKAAAKRNGATINDAFVAGMVEGAIRYHADRGVVLSHLNTSFVLSTRADNRAGGNAFTPVLVGLPGTPMPIGERVADVGARVAAARSDAGHASVTSLSGVVNLLPTSVVTRAARAKAASIDLATSNLRGAPFPLYVARSRVLQTIAQGPLAGTPCNATAMSAENGFDIGLFIDPVAVEAPGDLRTSVASAFADLLDGR